MSDDGAMSPCTQLQAPSTQRELTVELEFFCSGLDARESGAEANLECGDETTAAD
jgi:hypothetical protein